METETQLLIAIGTLGAAVASLFGLLMAAYKAVGAQKDLRLKAETAHNEKVESIRAEHRSELEDIKNILQSRSMNGRKPTERRGPDDSSRQG